MGANPRNKGKSGEYEVIKMLQIICDEIWREFWMVAPTLRRNTAQYADGGEDIAGLPWYAVEVKRCETLQLAKWWLQCSTEALKSHPTALVETFTEDCPKNWALTCKPFDFLGAKNSGFDGPDDNLGHKCTVVPKCTVSVHNSEENISYAPETRDVSYETGYVMDDLFPELRKVDQRGTDLNEDRNGTDSMARGRVRPSPKIDFSPSLNPEMMMRSPDLNKKLSRNDNVPRETLKSSTPSTLSPDSKREAFGFGTKIPILLFRQSKQRWRVMLPVQLPVGVDGRSMSSVGEISIEAFQLWLRSDIRARLLQVYGTPPIR
jgi:hypothetical protein